MLPFSVFRAFRERTSWQPAVGSHLQLTAISLPLLQRLSIQFGLPGFYQVIDHSVENKIMKWQHTIPVQASP